jgi:hypothetical protein
VADLTTLREHARVVTRTNEEISALRTEIAQIERGLQTSGSVRTDAELQADIESVSQTVYVFSLSFSAL